MMENHSYDQIYGNTLAPNINYLANTYGLANAYYGVTHPSEPNYVASVGGDYFGIQDDNPFTDHIALNPDGTPAKSIADQLWAAGMTWKTYQQSLPYDGYKGTRWPLTGPTLYASKHNGFLNFASVANMTEQQLAPYIVQDTELATDLQSGKVPNLSYIVPDQCNDMHGTTGCSGDPVVIPAGDAYVQNTVNEIMASSTWKKGNNAIVITWDENDFSTDTPNGCCDAGDGSPAGGGGHVLTIVITNQSIGHMVDNTPFNHYSLLQTIQYAFQLGCLQNTCDTVNVTPMARLFGAN
jgi:hypothetical protein